MDKAKAKGLWTAGDSFSCSSVGEEKSGLSAALHTKSGFINGL